MSALNKGTTLQNGKYVILRTLGHGGFGITYEAEQVNLGRTVAIKEFFMKSYCERDDDSSCVFSGSAGNKELMSLYLTKFIKEAKTIAKLNHPNIISIYDVFQENNTAYYVMEFISGSSLNDLVNSSGALQESQAIKLIQQVGDALSYAHDRHVMHLDVKPSNIMLEGERAILIDFGLSKQYSETGDQTSTTPVGISHGYAPLEQYQDGGVKAFTPATDVYSLGATLYKLITAQTPPSATEVAQNGLPSMPNSVSASVRMAIEKAMSFRNADRPQTIRDFLSLLGNNSDISNSDEETELIIKNPHDAPSQPPKPPKRFNWGIPLSILGGIALIALFWGMIDGQKKIEEDIHAGFQEQQQNKLEFLVQAPKRVEVSQRFDVVFEVKGGSPSDFLWSVGDGFTLVRGPQKEISDSSVSYSYVLQANRIGVYTLDAAYATVNALKLHTDPVPVTVVAKQNNSVATSETTPSGSLMVSSQPSGANIWVDGKDTKKKTPALLADISPGKHSVKLVLEGYTEYIVNISVASGKQYAINPSLSAIVRETPSLEQNTSFSSSGVINGHEWVDLGLSVKWATTNVGSSSSSGPGYYYSWGETEPKSRYAWANYKYADKGAWYEEEPPLTKYNSASHYGFVDNKTQLDMDDDVARRKWGGSWRIPTDTEMIELREKCTWTWSSQGGINGYKVTGKNQNSIFLPAAGCEAGEEINGKGARGYYWSSSRSSSMCTHADNLLFNANSVKGEGSARFRGFSVRPVTK